MQKRVRKLSNNGNRLQIFLVFRKIRIEIKRLRRIINHSDSDSDLWPVRVQINGGRREKKRRHIFIEYYETIYLLSSSSSRTRPEMVSGHRPMYFEKLSNKFYHRSFSPVPTSIRSLMCE